MKDLIMKTERWYETFHYGNITSVGNISLWEGNVRMKDLIMKLER